MSSRKHRSQEPDELLFQEGDGKTTPEKEYKTYATERAAREEPVPGSEPDLLLDVPVINVEEINLELENLRAHVSLQAEVADLVKINVGIDAYLNKAKLEIKGVEAQALLKVKLDRVLGTLDRALEAINNNPQIVTDAIESRRSAPEEKPEDREQAAGENEVESDLPGQGEAKETQGAATGEAADGVKVTEAARNKANELGVRLRDIKGTGSGGRVVLRDVIQAAQRR